MSYSTGSTYPRMILEANLTGGKGVFLDVSSDAATDINATGYYAGQGQPSTAAMGGVRGGAGMKYGDLLCHVESSLGANPGRVTWHAVTGDTAAISAASPLPSSAYGQGWNITVSAHAST